MQAIFLCDVTLGNGVMIFWFCFEVLYLSPAGAGLGKIGDLSTCSLKLTIRAAEPYSRHQDGTTEVALVMQVFFFPSRNTLLLITKKSNLNSLSEYAVRQ